MVRLTGLEGAPEALHQLVGIGGRPQDVHDLVEAPADQVGDVAEDRPRGGIDQPDAKLVVHQVDAERGVGEQGLELLLPLAERHGGLLPHPRELERPADPRDQLAGGERLHQVVVGAGVESFDAGLFPGARGQQDDRQVAGRGIGPERAQEREAVEAGHHDVAQQQVGRIGPGALEGRASVGHRLHRPARAQQALHVLAHVGVVVRHEDAGGAVGAALTGRGRLTEQMLAGDDLVVLLGPGQPALGFLDERRRAESESGGHRRGHLRQRQMLAPAGQRHGERRPAADLARHRRRAAVQLHQLVHQGQADAGALDRARAGVLHPAEPLEDVGERVGRDAAPGIAHGQGDAARPAVLSATRISPSKVNLKALETRFRTIFSHMSRST